MRLPPNTLITATSRMLRTVLLLSLVLQFGVVHASLSAYDVPTPVLAVGDEHACVVAQDGDVSCWGADEFQRLSSPPGTSFTQLSSGTAFTCGLTTSSSITCWGNNQDEQTEPDVSAVSTSVFVQVEAAGAHACSLTLAGAVACWGSSDDGESTPPPSLGAVVQLALGSVHSCALLTTGGVTCWGSDAQDQSTPPAFGGGATATSIAAGGTSTCAVLSTGAVQCWGSLTTSFSDTTYTQVAVGTSHVCALNSTGGIQCAGSMSDSPSTSTTYLSLACGTDFCCAIRSDTHLRCWGSADGSDQISDAPVPAQYAITTSGLAFTCAVTQQKAATCWGLGADDQTEAPEQSEPDRISCGNAHCCSADTTDAYLQCWGKSSGDNPADQSDILLGWRSAAAELNNEAVSAVSVGGNDFSCAIRSSDKFVRCWGSDTASVVSGVVGNVAASALSCGDKHCCLLRDDNSARECWGDDTQGQASPGGGAFEAISAGYKVTCSLDSAGSVTCFGLEAAGVVLPSAKAPYADVSCSKHLSACCGTRASDGEVVCAVSPSVPGDIDLVPDSQLTCLANTVSVGADHACCVYSGGSLAYGVVCWGGDEFSQDEGVTPGYQSDWFPVVTVQAGPSMAAADRQHCGTIYPACYSLSTAMAVHARSNIKFDIRDATATVSSVDLSFDGVVIQGNSGALGVTLDCNAQRCFELESVVDVAFSNVTLTNGNSDDAGGCILLDSESAASFTDSKFTNCRAYAGGAASLNSGSTLTCTRCVWSGNRASNVGGALHVSASSVVLIDSSFSSNLGFGAGGAIYISSVTTNTRSASFTSTQFVTNQAREGGAIYSDGQIVFTMTDSTFTTNSALEGDGGAMCLVSALSARLSDVTFTGNTAVEGSGGAFCADGGLDFDLTLSSLQFTGNSALAGGALYASGAALTMYMVDVTANSNTATEHGGAMYIANAANVTASSCTFNASTATTNGGAISALGGAGDSLTLSGVTVSHNSAGFLGGGAYILDIQLYADSTTTFSNNVAGESGGGLFISEAIGANLTGTRFESNTARGFASQTLSGTLTDDEIASSAESTTGSGTSSGGGAIGISEVSNPVALLDLRLSGNKAPLGNGGGIHVYASDALWLSIASAQNQAAPVGGGGIIFLDCDSPGQCARTAPTWVGGKPSAGSNTAAFGAVEASHAVSVKADDLSGASADHYPGDEVQPSLKFAVVDYFDQRCLGSSYQFASLTLEPSASFSGQLVVPYNETVAEFVVELLVPITGPNTAAQLLVSVSSVPSGETLSYADPIVIRVDNCTDGQEVSGTACSTCTAGKFSNASVEFCTDCPAGAFSEFAGATLCELCEAGSFSSSAGLSTCTSCSAGSFSSDDGSSGCTNCPEGKYQPSSFETGCLTCVAGTFSAESASECSDCADGTISIAESEACTTCPDQSTSGGTHVVCECNAGYYATIASYEDQLNTYGNETTFTCEACPTGLDCATSGVFFNEIEVSLGYWRASNTSTTIYQCEDVSHCQGGSTSECATGHTGTVCAVCAPNYHRLGGECTLCAGADSDSTTQTAGAEAEALFGSIVAVFAVFMVLLVVWLLKMPSNEILSSVSFQDMQEKASTGLAVAQGTQTNKLMTASRSGVTVGYNSISQKLKLLVSYLQIMTGLSLAFDISWPSSFGDFLSVLGFVNLDVTELSNVDCVVETDFYDRFLFVVLMPIVATGLLIAAGLLAALLYRVLCAHKWDYSREYALKARVIKTFLFFIFLVYPSVSATTLTLFKCREIEGEWYLQADFRLRCFDSTWNSYAVLGGICVLLYPVGVPAATLYVLYRYRHTLENPGTLYKYGFLYTAYTPSYWWFEAFELFRKLMLTSVIIFFRQGSFSQLFIGVLFTVGFLFATQEARPFANSPDYYLQIFSMLQLILTLVAALMIKSDEASVSEEREGYDGAALGGVLIFLTVSVIVMTVAMIVIEFACDGEDMWVKRVSTEEAMAGEAKEGGEDADDYEVVYNDEVEMPRMQDGVDPNRKLAPLDIASPQQDISVPGTVES